MPIYHGIHIVYQVILETIVKVYIVGNAAMDFANILKIIREERKLSLQELANKTGVSKSMLSKIEREEKNPTLQIAAQIAEGLQLSLSSMLEKKKQNSAILTRAADQIVFSDATTGFERRLLSPTFTHRGIEFIYNTIPKDSPGIVFPPHSPGVQEFIVVTKGTLKIKLDEDSFVLKKGDSLFFKADRQHCFYSEGCSECCYYLVIDSHNTTA